MSIVIIFNHKNPKPWLTVLQKKLPDVVIEIYPEVKDNSQVVFALCWKPEKHVLAQFPNLKLVQSVGASAEHIIQTQNLAEDIILARIVDSQLSIDMFEFILMGAMGYLKNLPGYFSAKENKIWKQKPYQTISNTTICVLGLGKIGAYVAKELSKVGFIVKGWSNSEKRIDGVSSFYGENGLEEALRSTDVLVNLLPLTLETENILCLRNLKHLNTGAYLINVGRGQHLVDEDLIQLLDSEHLSGALLDVFRVEPLPDDHPFWLNEKILITPHVASLTNVDTASNIVVENYMKFQRNEKPDNVISLQQGY